VTFAHLRQDSGFYEDKMGIFKEKQIKEDDMFMGMLKPIEDRSYDDKYQVAAILARGNKILSYGWNGTPMGMANETRINGESKWEVVHAEANALCKLASATESSEGATLYCSLSPCKECSKLLLQAGIKRVVFRKEYQAVAIEFLKENGVKVEKY